LEGFRPSQTSNASTQVIARTHVVFLASLFEFHFCSFGSRLSGNIRDFGNSSATQLGQQGTQNYPNGDNHSLFQERLVWRAAKGRLYLTVLVGGRPKAAIDHVALRRATEVRPCLQFVDPRLHLESPPFLLSILSLNDRFSQQQLYSDFVWAAFGGP